MLLVYCLSFNSLEHLLYGVTIFAVAVQEVYIETQRWFLAFRRRHDDGFRGVRDACSQKVTSIECCGRAIGSSLNIVTAIGITALLIMVS